MIARKTKAIVEQGRSSARLALVPASVSVPAPAPVTESFTGSARRRSSPRPESVRPAQTLASSTACSSC